MDFKKSDDIFTIDLPGSDLIFTRYLYVKDEVRIALLVSILNKKDDAIFWAYELYYSGFKNELINLIWKIYYDFFVTLNPTFDQYLLKKHKELLQLNDDNDRIISSIIQDLLFRPFNTDVFMLRNICENFEIDIVYHNNTEKITDMIELHKNFEHWVKTNDYRSISQWVLNINQSFKIEHIYRVCLDIFETNGLKITKSKLEKDFNLSLKININPNIILLSKIMLLFSKKEDLKKGKSIYINADPEDIIPYETICGSDELKHYRILENVYVCGIDELKHLSLFKLKRNKYNLRDKYLNNWEYHASFSPIWSQRIRKYRGYVDYNKQKVIINDELLEEFYMLYGLEPDEQKKEIQNKSIMGIEKKYDWKQFNTKYKKNGLFEVYEEELDEFNITGLLY